MNNRISILLLGVVIIGISACSSSRKTPSKETESAPQEKEEKSQKQESETQITSSSSDVDTQFRELEARVQILSNQLQSMEHKLTKTENAFNSYFKNRQPPKKTMSTTVVKPQAVDEISSKFGKNAKTAMLSGGFVDDEAINQYRAAKVFFESNQFSEAILEFTSFLKSNPNHPLAGAAQFYIGESYFKQKEHRLALEEYDRVLASYNQSSFVADALSRMVEVEATLKMSKQEQKHLQLLQALFPHSPAAKRINETQKNQKKSNPVPKQTTPPTAAKNYPVGSKKTFQFIESGPPTAPLPKGMPNPSPKGHLVENEELS